MKKLLLVTVSMVMITVIFAQEVQILTVNQYKEPNPFNFSYFFKDRFANDSLYPHLSPIYYVNADCFLCVASVDTENMRLICFDSKYNVKYYKDFGLKNIYVIIGRQYWALFTQEVFNQKQIELYLYSRSMPDIPLASYKGLAYFKSNDDIAACISPPFIFKVETIEGLTAPWYKIKIWNGLEGWVFGAYIDIDAYTYFY